MGKIMRAIGLMSGTSLDGIDVAYLETDGEYFVRRGPAMTFPYSPDTRELLRKALDDAVALKQRHERPGHLSQAELHLTDLHATALSDFLRLKKIARNLVDVIGFHGQTVLHRPDVGLTVQLGLGDRLAQHSQVPVVYDLRARDVAAGGQGAPLVPVYHRALANAIKERPLAIVNIGGVANITWIGSDERLIAFDTGPGNALVDDWMTKTTGRACDEYGQSAQRGIIQHEIIARGLNDKYFAAPPPKSLDRNTFSIDLVKGLGVDDGAATLAAFTASAIARAREHLPEQPLLWVIGGGGRHNRAIMEHLAGLVEHAVVPCEALGWDGDSLEAEAWGYLAVRSLAELPISFPLTTGVRQPISGGTIALPPPLAAANHNPPEN